MNLEKTMKLLPRISTYFLLCIVCYISRSLPAFSQTAPASGSASQHANTERDESHDFDFNFGVWHTHIKRIMDPFSGSGNSIELDGTVTVRKVWGGRAQLEEIEADGPKGHWEGMTLFLYNPQSHQWSQSFINSKMAALSAPLIGMFKDGRGELFAQDTFHDKSILVRGVWSEITPDLGDHRRYSPIRTSIFRRRREDLGNKLDQQIHASERWLG